MSLYRILLVDDDVFFLQVYGDFLRSRGFEVETVQDVDLLLDTYQSGRFQLVIIDLAMPGVSGIDLIERIRRINPSQDVIVVTGSDDVRTAVRAMRLGVYDYLVKPIEREELILIIDRLQERATLYDEHARLLNENIEYAELQRIFTRALRIMQSLELETVCDRLLETLSEACAAQGAAIWLGREDSSDLSMHGYRGLVEAATLPMAWTPEGGPIGRELLAGLPVPVPRDLGNLVVHALPAPALLVPLTREGRLVGVVQLVDKLGGAFDARDVSHCKILADAGTTAVLHARRFRNLERVGLRDPTTSAYNMTYFVDYLGRELHKARRYQRSFSLLQVSVDNLENLRQSLRPEIFREAIRRVVLAISSILSDIDVLARVTDSEMYLLLPEADFLKGLAFVRAARDAIQKSPFLTEIDRQHPIQVSFGPAAFPRDGDDVDQLFAACRRRLDEARRSIFRRLHLEDVDFWSAVDLLIGPEELYQGHELLQARQLTVTEDERGLSRHHLFPPGGLEVMRSAVLGEAQRQGRASGWLYLGGRWGDAEAAVQLRRLGAGSIRTYVLGSAHPEGLGGASLATPVRVEGDAFERHEVMLMLAEHSAYGLLARRRADGRLFGFHTADWTLVEGLIDKLQGAYHLQKGGT